MGVNGKINLNLDLGVLLFAAEICHGFSHETQIQIKADTCDMPGLFAAEQVTGAANFKVFHRQLQTCAQLVMGSYCFEAFMRDLTQALIRRVQEVSISPFTPAAHTPAQLVQLTQSIILSVINNQGIGV